MSIYVYLSTLFITSRTVKVVAVTRLRRPGSETQC